MKAILTILLLFIFSVCGFSQTRSVMVDTSSVVVQPTNLWSANASSARSGLGLVLPALTNANNSDFRNSIGLGSAATNAASAFQPSSTSLSNLSSGNGGGLTNLNASNIVGVIPSTNIGTVNFSNISGTLTVSSGGTGATNPATARTNLGLGWSALTNTNASGFISALYGSGTNPVLTDSNGNVVSPTNFVWLSGGGSGTYYSRIQSFTNGATHSVTNGSHVLVYSLFSGATNTTNTLDLPTLFSGGATNGDMITVIHLGSTSSVTGLRKAGNVTNFVNLNRPDESLRLIYNGTDWIDVPSQAQNAPIYFSGTNASGNAGISRINLGVPSSLGSGSFSAIGGGESNSASGNWSTVAGGFSNRATLQYATVVGGQNNTASGSRSFVGSGQLNTASGGNSIVVGGFSNQATATDSIVLGGSANLANGQNAIVVGGAYNKAGGSYSFAGGIGADAPFSGSFVWADTQFGSFPITNFFSATNADSFNVRANGGMHFDLGTNGIKFIGSNALDSAGATRTNLGLGASWLLNTNVATFRTDIGLGANDTPIFSRVIIGLGATSSIVTTAFIAGDTGDGREFHYGANGSVYYLSNSEVSRINMETFTFSITSASSEWTFNNSIKFNNTTNATLTRSNLGIPLAALTNTNTTNFQGAIFSTGTAPTNTTNVNSWMNIQVGTNSFKVPLYR